MVTEAPKPVRTSLRKCSSPCWPSSSVTRVTRSLALVRRRHSQHDRTVLAGKL